MKYAWGGGEGRGLRSTLSCQLYFLLQGLVQAERHNMNEVLYSNKDCCEPTHKSSECFDGGWVLNGVQGQGRQHLEDGCQVGLGLLKPAALRYLPHQLCCQVMIGHPAAKQVSQSG